MATEQEVDRGAQCLAIVSAGGEMAIVRVDDRASVLFFDGLAASTFKRCIDGLKGKADVLRIGFYRDVLRDCSLGNLNRLLLQVIKP